MLIDLFLFPLFAAALSLIGLGFWATSKKAFGFHGATLPPFLLPLLGAFAAGFASLIVNFFSPVAVSITYTTLGTLLVAGLITSSHSERKSILYLSLLAALCTPLAADMQPGPDAGLYHLPHQLWLRDHKVVFGLANLHGRFGFSSFLEYINALFWIGESFKLLSYMSAIFFVSFLSFTFFAVNQSNPATRMISLLVAVNVLVFDGYFNWKYGYADSPAGIVFALSILLGVYILEVGQADRSSLKNRHKLDAFLFAFLIISAMSVALKVSSILIVLWVVFVVLVTLTPASMTMARALAISGLPLVFAVIWTLRGIVTSGCLLFPASWSCFVLPWASKQEAALQANWVTAWARHPHSGLSSLEGWSWLENYWLMAHTHFLLYMALCTAVVFVLGFALHHFFKTKRLPTLQSITLVCLVLAALTLWFIKAPTDRFGIGIFMIAAPAVALVVFGAPIFKQGLLLKVVSVLLIVGLANNQGGFSLKGLTRFQLLTVPSTEVVPDAVYGVRPRDGDGCWTAKHCSPYDRPAPQEKSGYLFFAPVSD